MEQLLHRLLGVDGVTAALIVAKDGQVRAGTIDGDEAEVLGAMAAAAFEAASRYIDAVDLGGLRSALFELDSGIVQIVESGDSLILARCLAATALGRVRLEVQRAARAKQHLAQ